MIRSTAALLRLLLALPLALAGLAVAEQRPNIVLILTDDQGYADLACYGSETIRTPNIDRLAREGVRLTDFYAAAASCTASRAGLLTGCTPRRVGLGGPVLFPHDTHGLHPDEVTVAELLRDAGYATACFGKWHLGRPTPLLPTAQGFDTFFGIPSSNDMGRLDQYGTPFPRPPARHRAEGIELLRDAATVASAPDQRRFTADFTRETIAFIEANRDRPFFVHLAHPMPHLPLFASPAFEGRSPHGRYADVIEEIDWSVGEILRALERLGLDGRTLVIFTSDNGPWLEYGELAGSAGPFRAGKGTTWEGGSRVPCLWRWPEGLPPGLTVREPITALDILPTVAAMVGIDPPVGRELDGIDVSRALRDPEHRLPSRPIFFHHAVGGLEAVRFGRWKLHLRKHASHNAWDATKLGRFRPFLVDLETDPGEATNLADQRPGLVDALRRLCVAYDRALRAEARPAFDAATATFAGATPAPADAP